MGRPTITCTQCHRPDSYYRRGWCATCYRRWQRAGKPAGGPPPGGTPRKGRRTDDGIGWMARAACRAHEPELWWPASREDPRIAMAKAICDAEHGIWGGLTEEERGWRRRGAAS